MEGGRKLPCSMAPRKGGLAYQQPHDRTTATKYPFTTAARTTVHFTLYLRFSPLPVLSAVASAWQVNVFLTYMGDRYLELEDVDNVHLKLHPLVYTNKTWTPRKLLLRMRRDVILDVLSQVCPFADGFDGYVSSFSEVVECPGKCWNTVVHRGALSSTRSGYFHWWLFACIFIGCLQPFYCHAARICTPCW